MFMNYGIAVANYEHNIEHDGLFLRGLLKSVIGKKLSIIG